MCTAVTYKTKDFYFGRTLDYEFSYGDEITITPRNFPLHFTKMGDVTNHFAIIGMAHIEQNFPLYYDAVNEKGLAMAGLNFVGNAVYGKEIDGKDNVAQFEFIPYILGQCSNVEEVIKKLQTINITNTPFSDKLPVAKLHWLIADEDRAITVESVADGLKIYDNPVGTLTNNPTFDMQMFALNNFRNLSPKSKENSFSKGLNLAEYSRGMGAIGLPGDLSSQSRFVRVVFTKMNSISNDSEEESVGQFFHILGAVEQQRGCCELENGKFEITIYTSCCNANKGIYYYTTYNNHQISAVDMNKENLEDDKLIRYDLLNSEHINFQN